MSTVGKCRKGEKMGEVMTDFQFKALLEMVLAILSKCKDKDEAIAEIEKLLKEKQ